MSHSELTYPLEAHLEIGEAMAWPLDSDPVRPEGGALGLERLAIAAGETVPSFEESRLSLLESLQQEAARDGKTLPAGYERFAALGLR
jgi:hypothetical protein